MRWAFSDRVHLANERISNEDGARQEQTAKHILRLFENEPGVILADEVGMGKTYVALAVAVSIIDATRGERPVVVMVPASVQAKWPREWQVFEERCLTPGLPIRATTSSVRSGSDFLKLLDDPESRRNHVIFLTHGALTNSLSDPFVKLAIVRRALLRPSLAAERRAFPRWAGSVLASRVLRSPKLVEALLSENPRHWRRVYERASGRAVDDDLVPRPILDALKSVDLSPLVDALAELPLRQGKHIEWRLKNIRVELKEALREVWRSCLRNLDLELPLLILDEAHHAKNPQTVLASLFASKEATQDAELLRGPLAGVFDRMLFLTATPFQLGHHELIEVLRRFAGIRWSSALERQLYEERLAELSAALNRAQTAALRLDRAWGRLAFGEVAAVGHPQWWEEGGSPALNQVARHYEEAKNGLVRCETLLRPFVVRHVRPDKASRRAVFEGDGILVTRAEGPARGLSVSRAATLPFLLAARVRALVAAEARIEHRRTRALFSEGIASSFEAYRQTRLRQESVSLVDDVIAATVDDYSTEVDWYLDRLDESLPTDGLGVAAQHPKIAATVARVADLWSAGEKVVVFCFYIATGRALRAHISDALDRRILELGAAKLGMESENLDEVRDVLRRAGERFFAPDAPITRRSHELLNDLFQPYGLDDDERGRCVDIAVRFIRTSSFLVRYLELGDDSVEALERALATGDESERTLRGKIEGFGKFVASRVPAERFELLDALDAIQTGGYFAASAASLDPGETYIGRGELLPNVRLANGEVSRELRNRLMLAFNTPFFPEVLIASSVMGEGVDLHLECRHVIHHDLDWNPSVLEQRTGRLDRLGSKAELTRRPVVVFEPYVEGTQDEKQFRVVKDRERWFNVVMGERLQLDEWATDQLAERVPFPRAAADGLTLRLDVAD